MSLELPHLPHGHLVGDARQHAQRLVVVQADQLDDRPRIEIVPHDYRDLMGEQRVDRGQPASQYRVIDGVVVHERREVDQLDDGGERHRARILGSCRLVTEQEQRGPEEFPFHL